MTGKTDPVYLGVDPGREHVGLAVIDELGNICFLENAETNNKTVKDNMDSRRASRSARRSHERQKKQRKAIADEHTISSDSEDVKVTTFNGKPVPAISTSYPRMKDGSIEQKVIRGKEAQFANRSIPKG